MTMSSCTLYKIEDEEITLTEIKKAINEKDFVDKNYGLELRTIINVYKITQDKLWGSALYERPVKVSRLEGNKIISDYQKRAAQSDFVFFTGSSLHFLSFSGIGASERIGSKLNQSISVTIGKNDVILNCYFSPDVIEKFLSGNPYTPRYCNWKDLNIPGTTTSSLGGSSINRGPDFNRYNQHGNKKSIRITLHENDWTIELYDCGSIKFFNDVSDQEKLDFVQEKILLLL